MSEKGDGMPVIGRSERGPLLGARLKWEAENPRPESLRRVERAIVRALDAEGFGTQHQVTRADGFDIAVNDLVIHVEHDETRDDDAMRAYAQRASTSELRAGLAEAERHGDDGVATILRRELECRDA